MDNSLVPSDQVTKVKQVNQVPEGYTIRVKHYHPGNSTLAQRKKSSYRSIAVVTNANNTALIITDARCHPSDVPSRKLGYRIAHTRALRELERFILSGARIHENALRARDLVDEMILTMENVQLGLSDDNPALVVASASMIPELPVSETK